MATPSKLARAAAALDAILAAQRQPLVFEINHNGPAERGLARVADPALAAAIVSRLVLRGMNVTVKVTKRDA